MATRLAFAAAAALGAALPPVGTASPTSRAAAPAMGRRRARFMAWNIIDGKAIAAETRAGVARDVEAFVQRTGRRPGLATVLVGEDAASAIYVGGKQKACREVGIEPFD